MDPDVAQWSVIGALVGYVIYDLYVKVLKRRRD